MAGPGAALGARLWGVGALTVPLPPLLLNSSVLLVGAEQMLPFSGKWWFCAAPLAPGVRSWCFVEVELQLLHVVVPSSVLLSRKCFINR